MQSQGQVQQVWDSFVLHLKSLSDGLQLAHEVFTQPEEEVKVRLALCLLSLTILTLAVQDLKPNFASLCRECLVPQCDAGGKSRSKT